MVSCYETHMLGYLGSHMEVQVTQEQFSCLLVGTDSVRTFWTVTRGEMMSVSEL